MSFIAKLAAIVISFSLCAAGLLFVPRKSATKTERRIQTQTPVLLRKLRQDIWLRV
jgi:hypothetical protein